MNDLLITGDPRDLEELRQRIAKEVGPGAHLQTTTSAEPGELREPILIGLIVALGGPVVTTAIVNVIKDFLKHKQAMAKIANERQASENRHELAMAFLRDDDREEPVTLDALQRMATQ